MVENGFNLSSISGIALIVIAIVLYAIKLFVLSKKVKQAEEEQVAWQRETYSEGYANYSANLSNEL